METQYQRNKIQEESLYYEGKKHSGELEIVGVNMFLNPKVISGEYVRPEIEMARASYEEKDKQLKRLDDFHKSNTTKRDAALKMLTDTVIGGGNAFAALMQTVRHASLGEITDTLYRVGGKYRRSM